MNLRLARTYLVDLYKLGAGEKYIKVPTGELAALFGVSQQSASRILQELFEMELVDKRNVDRTLWVRLTDKGLAEVEDYIRYINDAYERPGRFYFKGVVVSGLGEGAYYMSRKGYVIQFERLLGFTPYPGTLNLKLTEPYYIFQNRLLRKLRGIHIKGFRTKERVFGDVRAFKAVIQGSIEGAVIYAERSIYGFDMLEVIAPIYLRDALKLKDGDLVEVEVYLSESR